MAAISQITFSNAFLWMKSFEFWIQFHRPGISSLNTNTYFNFEFSIQQVNKGSCYNIPLKCTVNQNFARPCSSIPRSSVVQSFWNFAHGMAVSQPCSVHNFKMIGQLFKTLWANVYVDSGMDFRYHIETSPRPSLWCPYHSLWPMARRAHPWRHRMHRKYDSLQAPNVQHCVKCDINLLRQQAWQKMRGEAWGLPWTCVLWECKQRWEKMLMIWTTLSSCLIILHYYQCFKLKFSLSHPDVLKNFPPYMVYYNFYSPRVKFNWSSPIFGRQGKLGMTTSFKLCIIQSSWVCSC